MMGIKLVCHSGLGLIKALGEKKTVTPSAWVVQKVMKDNYKNDMHS